MTSRLACLLLALVPACGGGTEMPDAAPPPDAAQPPDARLPPDAYVAPDAYVPPDAAVPGPIEPTTALMVGSPTWHVAEWQQISAPMGTTDNGFADSVTTFQAIMPLHTDYPAINFWGPDASQPHPPPYDTELSTGVTAAGFTSNRLWTRADWIAPKGLFLIGMIVPNTGAPEGSSPDFTMGPIIPDVLWPVTIDTDLYWNGVLRDPTLDSMYPRVVDLPIYVAGYSHMTVIFAENTEFISGETGNYLWHVSIADADGNGWYFEIPFTVIE